MNCPMLRLRLFQCIGNRIRSVAVANNNMCAKQCSHNIIILIVYEYSKWQCNVLSILK